MEIPGKLRMENLRSRTLSEEEETVPKQETGPTSPRQTENNKCAVGAVNHMWKFLFRKHSSGDLHSRLKTRKLLGVGETDDGDVHRSKLSQILGHSEQLYVKLPKGLRIWQAVVASIFSLTAFWALSFPGHMFALDAETDQNALLPTRLYGAALLGMAIVLWSTMQSMDRDVIRWSIVASVIYFILQFIVTLPSLFNIERTSRYQILYQFVKLGATSYGCFLYHTMMHKALKAHRQNTGSPKGNGDAGHHYNYNTTTSAAEKKFE